MPTSAAATGRVVVYFDPFGTERYGMSPGTGELQTLFIYGEDFGADFVSGLQYAIDYGSDLNFIVDLSLPPVSIGTSATGISLGFGNVPRPGGKFLAHLALVQWATNCGASSGNDVVVGPHPAFPDPTPIATTFPTQDVVSANGAVSGTCQALMVEIDIKPGACPNAFNMIAWRKFYESDNPNAAGFLPVAILGSDVFDVSDVDLSTVMLEGVPHSGKGLGKKDISAWDGDNDCDCDAYPAGDGIIDQPMRFNRQLLAQALPTPQPGDVIELTLTGNLLDGTPFTAKDCIEIVGETYTRAILSDPDDGSLGAARPNPFNPVTRISYTVPANQHVLIAIYDVAGRLVENLVDETKSAGEYVVEWDAGRLPSGVYFYRMKSGSETFVRRAVLLK